jgi:hypothetical protein
MFQHCDMFTKLKCEERFLLSHALRHKYMKEMCHMGLEVTCPLLGREGARGIRLF